jgi:hypothetical protein
LFALVRLKLNNSFTGITFVMLNFCSALRWVIDAEEIEKI